jgi:Protein of unknown function (DUF2924)
MSRSLSEREREKLAGEIAGLQSLDVEQLKVRWRTLYQTEAPTRFSRELLMRAVAYRLQERHSRAIFAKKWAVVQKDALPYWVGKDSSG